MNVNYYQLCKSKKCKIGFNFIISLNDFDKKTGECFLKENQKRLYFFTWVKYNLQTFLDFNVAFCKEFVLAAIREREKEQKEIVDASDDDNENIVFCGKYPFHPHEKLKRLLNQKLEEERKKIMQ